MATTPAPYPRRLIEVDLPIRQISEHARREKSIRHGHISTLHLWWARRPLAACRAVILASLWPDPADPLCPEAFREAARRELRALRDKRGGHPYDWDDNLQLRRALLAFIADFANWDLSNDPDYLATSRTLVRSAHEALGGEPGTRPLVVDPFAGGGAIPLEALRVGADAFASDLNPVAVLLNKVVLEYIPKYGSRLVDEVRKWGAWIKEQTEKELAKFYPTDPDGSTPIAYLWARTIRCEGPGCGVKVPLVRSLWLSTRSGVDGRTLLRVNVDRPGEGPSFQPVIATSSANAKGTVRLGIATCSCCGFLTGAQSVKSQLKAQSGGSSSATLIAVVYEDSQGKRRYRSAIQRDISAYQQAASHLEKLSESPSFTRWIPDEPTPEDGTGSLGGGYRTRKYGITRYREFFSSRQLLVLATYCRLVGEALPLDVGDSGFVEAVRTVLALSVSRYADIFNANCTWESTKTQVRHLFSRQAIAPVWDFAEANPFAGAAGDFTVTIGTMIEVMERLCRASLPHGSAMQRAAQVPILPEDSVDAVVSDPPYYDSVPYSELSDFFWVWISRMLGRGNPPTSLTPKNEECIVNLASTSSTGGLVRDSSFFERTMTSSMEVARRDLRADGIGVVVFAHKSTAGWETQLRSLIEAGWVITGSWPLDTELANRLRAQGSAALASSVHIIVRPRENPDGSLRTDSVGDWNDVLEELPKRISAWLPRLAAEGVVGADAIFACLGPALEIFSRYSRVEKASGDVVPLHEYLERVWAEVARQALSMIFAGADTSGFGQDARLTAMWLWTLSTNKGGAEESDDEEGADDEEDAKPAGKSKGGFGLEYDAARKIAQGLGASLESLTTLVEVKGDSARLLGVGERESALFPKKGAAKVEAPAAKKAKKAQLALALGDTTPTTEAKKTDVAAEPEELAAPAAGGTMLDRVHQAMLMFRAGRSAAMKRFLVEDGVGREERFWKLAQALSALYPAGTEEKRWVDGVLARKKGLGL